MITFCYGALLSKKMNSVVNSDALGLQVANRLNRHFKLNAQTLQVGQENIADVVTEFKLELEFLKILISYIVVICHYCFSIPFSAFLNLTLIINLLILIFFCILKIRFLKPNFPEFKVCRPL